MTGQSTDDTLRLLAAHATGDFPLQTDWMAENKFDSPFARATHVTTYTAAFLPVRRNPLFLGLLWVSHFVIDSRRWNDTVPIWYDQALHVIALAVVSEIADRYVDTETQQEGSR